MYSCDSNPVVVSNNLSRVKWENIQFIEDNLSRYEKVSLLFLLHGHGQPATGYNNILQLINPSNQGPTTFLKQWASNNNNWENVLREALTLIQNFAILDKLGLDYQDECLRFLPRQSDCSVYIHPLIKILYHLCEDSTKEVVKSIVNEMRKVATLVDDFIMLEYFEVNILNWIQKGVIKVGGNDKANVSMLLQVLKTLELEKYYDLLKNAENRVNVNQSNCLSNDLINTSQSLSSCTVVNRSLSDYYNLDIDNMGVCLIIDEKDFAPSFVTGAPTLETRYGTEIDRQKVSDMFSSYGYRIVVKQNLKSFEILNTVDKYANELKPSDCSFVVCILSHGHIGAVFGTDCLPVDISKINQRMRSKQLLNKPSILLIQACQTPVQSSFIKQELTIDGHHMLQDAAMTTACDFVIFNSTVEGYASIRDKKQGSWFIQEVCDVLDKYGEEREITELFKQITRNVVQKIWTHKNQDGCMVPKFSSTFIKNFVFPRRRGDRRTS
ncbi:caspase-8-like [Ctenocephalides felis]|uniref:caspase-8-like n=1 Tax=Ctenocephalides felis TaxID=7515 RepID=UPI000E6E23D3|nr:caspase-8-like [Ctenocephalides felis]